MADWQAIEHTVRCLGKVWAVAAISSDPSVHDSPADPPGPHDLQLSNPAEWRGFAEMGLKSMRLLWNSASMMNEAWGILVAVLNTYLLHGSALVVHDRT